MACCPTEEKFGYPHGRFEKDVDETFHCSICYNVLREPRTCRHNDHIFCLACITQHLNTNTKTCPECYEDLNIATLRRPRLVNKYLSKLKINCDYASRGCHVFSHLEQLETHAETCGYAPVLCSNTECGMEINKQDKVHHESEVCEYRRVKCHECAEMKETVVRLEARFVELMEKVEAVKQIDTDAKGNLGALEKKVEALRAESMKEIREVKQTAKDVAKEVTDTKGSLFKVSKDVQVIKVMMAQMLKKLNIGQLLNKLPCPTEGMLNASREDILITSGFGRYPTRTSEIFSWEKNCWAEVALMNEDHEGASSFMDKGRLFVVGGEGNKTIESCDLNELPLKWEKLLEKLPYQSHDHRTVVYQDRIIYIGGCNHEKDTFSGVISELKLASPCMMEELCQMPEPRAQHGAEVFESKVLILGGYCSESGTMDSVLQFDPRRNECKEMPKLPYPLTAMTTVRWKEEVVVLGGWDKNDNFRNEVFTYNCRTGQIKFLPSMLQKKSRCCAVVTGDTIVVLGGINEEDGILHSVECYTMGGSTWEYLPAMNKARYRAVAEVLPCSRKYV